MLFKDVLRFFIGVLAALVSLYVIQPVFAEATGSHSVKIEVTGKQLFVNGKPFTIKGLCYSPMPVGYDYSYNWSEHPEIYENDFRLMKEMGCNTIRIFGAEPYSRKMLDAALKNNLYVIIGYWVSWEDDLSDPMVRSRMKSEFEEMVNRYKGHPAVLMWVFGCEVNTGSKWGSTQYWYTLLEEAAALAHRLDNRPVTTPEVDAKNIGNSALKADDASLKHLDLWAVNVFWDEFLGNAFSKCASRTKKPFWFEQIGHDAYNSKTRSEDEDMQAAFISKLWLRIAKNLSAEDPQKNCIGATFFEWSDEWWKSSKGKSYTIHDTIEDWRGGSNIDPSIQEEWFGIVAINPDNYNRRLRKAYFTLQEYWR